MVKRNAKVFILQLFINETKNNNKKLNIHIL